MTLYDRRENLRFLCPNCHSQCKHKYNKGYTKVTYTSKKVEVA